MGLFKKAMASVGIGSTKVDAILNNETVQAGTTVTGNIHIKGGKVEQKIDNIYLSIDTKYEKPSGDDTVTCYETLQKKTINVGGVIQPKQEAVIPFEITLPADAPITMGKVKTWLSTGLDIKKALDPTDRDYIKVLPHDYMLVVLDAIFKLGFTLRESENEYCKNKSGLPFVQEFEFVPTSAFKGQLDEIEVVFYICNDGIGLAMEIDRKARGLKGFFAEMLDMDETNTKLAFSHQQLQQGSDYIAQLLLDYIAQYA